MGIKLLMYNLLVNRDPMIKLNYERYVTEHPCSHSKHRWRSWLYLVKLNMMSVLKLKASEKKNKAVMCESEKGFGKSPEEIAEELSGCECVSFDIFDTLIFRPLSAPADMFFIVGERLGVPDYKSLRVNAEKAARAQKNYSSEVTLQEILQCLEAMTGIPAEQTIKAELYAELSLCFANPFMKDVWELVRKRNKRIIIVSDMYLPSDFLKKLLEKNGFTGFEKIFVSCEQGCGKYSGELYKKVSEYLKGASCAHIGDNYLSDTVNAKKAGFKAVSYINVDHAGNELRPNDMSSIIGSAYRGLVNSKLYCGKHRFSAAYEYGYKVGGIVVLGYCGFIHKAEIENKADKVLFFSRDGYIIKKVYDELFPESRTEYVYWSRAAAAKLCAQRFRYDFFRRFIFQKYGGKFTVSQIMEAMGLSDMRVSLSPSEILTPINGERLAEELTARFDEVLKHYEGMRTAAERCFSEMLGGCGSVLTVDCGWAGSGAILFDSLVNDLFKLGCSTTGLIAGTNSYNQPDRCFSDTYLQNGRLLAYCFSPSHNRDIYKAHYPGAAHNVFFELLFGAPHPSCVGYEPDGDSYRILFDDEAENEGFIKEIHRGILDFISDYTGIWNGFDYMMNISGSDAYAPFMHTVIGNEKNVKAAFPEVIFDNNVQGRKEKLSQM